MAWFGLVNSKEVIHPPRLAYPLIEDSQMLRELMGNEPPPELGDVLGLSRATVRIVRTLSDELKDPGGFEDYNQRKSQAFLFLGPPGSGKTMLTLALANEGGDKVKVLPVKLSKLRNEKTGGVLVNLEKLFDIIQTHAYMQEEDEKGLGGGFIRRGKREKKTILVLIDEFESMALNKRTTTGMTPEEIAAVSALLTKMDELGRHTTSVKLLLTSNHPRMTEGAALDRVVKVRFYSPDRVTLKHMYLKEVSDEMFRQDSNSEMFDKTLIDAVAKYRKVSERYHKALKNGSDEDINKAMEELRELYSGGMEELLGKAIDSSKGFSGRDVKWVMELTVKSWISEKARSKKGMFRRGHKVNPISDNLLAIVASETRGSIPPRPPEEVDEYENPDLIASTL